MPTYSYPTSIDLMEIEQDLVPRLEADRPVFDLFPVVTEDADVIAWEQRDNYVGLMAVRGANNEPPRVKKIGGKRYVMEPGFYGEHEPVDEKELTARRRWGILGTPVSIDDLVMPIQEQLLGRQYDRIEWMIWALMATGTFSVPGPTGAPLHTDSYTLQTYTAPVTWATAATAAPLNDFRQVQLLARGHSVDFTDVAVAFMNQATFNSLANNTNNADLYGRRNVGLATYNNLQGFNQLLTGDNLPRLQIYDRGYLDDTGAFQLFIPNNTVIVVGKRPAGAPVGNWVYSRNINHEDGGVRAGPYYRVIDIGEQKVPRRLEVHRGFNGGLKLFYPSAIVRMTV
jgi:hypothetical protein